MLFISLKILFSLNDEHDLPLYSKGFSVRFSISIIYMLRKS